MENNIEKDLEIIENKLLLGSEYRDFLDKNQIQGYTISDK